MSSDWPDGVPRDYTELFAEYYGQIFQRVAALNKVPGNLNDLVQLICQRIFEAKVIEKYLAAHRYPEFVTAVLAAAFLGVRWEQWLEAMAAGDGTLKHSKPIWMPKPIKGGLYDKEAVFKTEHILILRDMGFFKEIPFPSKPLKPSGQQFVPYLMAAVHNTFANFCRDEQSRIGDLKDPEEDGSAWESRVRANMGCTEERFLDLLKLLRNSKLDMTEVRTATILDIATRLDYERATPCDSRDDDGAAAEIGLKVAAHRLRKAEEIYDDYLKKHGRPPELDGKNSVMKSIHNLSIRRPAKERPPKKVRAPKT